MNPGTQDTSFAGIRVLAARLDRHCDDVVVVVGTGGAKAGRMPGVTPCLTRNRAALGFYGPWTPHDFGRAIQIARNPLKVLRCGEGISDRQLGMMVGNALL